MGSALQMIIRWLNVNLLTITAEKQRDLTPTMNSKTTYTVYAVHQKTDYTSRRYCPERVGLQNIETAADKVKER